MRLAWVKAYEKTERKSEINPENRSAQLQTLIAELQPEIVGDIVKVS